MIWLNLDKEFCDSMRMSFKEIPNTDYGKGKYKPFFPLMKIGPFVYITQITSPKPRHEHLNEGKDLIKLHDNYGRFIGVVNLNYMFPLLGKNYEALTEKAIEELYLDTNPLSYTKKQLNFLNILTNDIKYKNIPSRAIELYKYKFSHTDTKLAQRCLDYKELEAKCLEINLQEDLQEDELRVTRENNLFMISVGDNKVAKTYNGLNNYDGFVNDYRNQLQMQQIETGIDFE